MEMASYQRINNGFLRLPVFPVLLRLSFRRNKIVCSLGFTPNELSALTDASEMWLWLNAGHQCHGTIIAITGNLLGSAWIDVKVKVIPWMSQSSGTLEWCIKCSLRPGTWLKRLEYMLLMQESRIQSLTPHGSPCNSDGGSVLSPIHSVLVPLATICLEFAVLDSNMWYSASLSLVSC